MSVFQLPRNLKAKALKMIVQKTILSFWVCVCVCVTWCHSEKPFFCKGAIPGWWHIMLQPIHFTFGIPSATGACRYPLTTTSDILEVSEESSTRWSQVGICQWSWSRTCLTCQKQHVSHTHASSQKVGSYLFIDHIEEVNMYSHVQNPFL